MGFIKMDSKDFILPFFDFKILGIFEAEELVENDIPNKWNIVSIYSPHWDIDMAWHRGQWIDYRPLFPKAKRLCQEKFADIDREEEDMIICTEQHIKNILRFGEECIGESILVHCHAGQSRSTAIAYLILLNALKDKVDSPSSLAMEIVIKNRRIATPNRHIINIGVPLIAKDEDTQIRWFRELYSSPNWR
jgi:rhodanese-related sulfurtransferase